MSAQERLWDMLRGATVTRALGIAAELRVADALADGPRPVAELGGDPDTLHRILRALASDGVFEETEPGVFANTEASELLRTESWREFAHLFGGVFHRAIADLDAGTATATFPAAFGSDFWEWLAAHPDERASFDRAMGGEKRGAVDRLAALDWRGDETVVDVGGGNGTLLRAFLERRPGLRGVVFDLPETVRDESAFGEGLTFVAGDFFAAVPSGDAYVLSGILHDWDDERAGAILDNIREAARPGARVLVTDSVVPSGNDPSGAKWLDLLMLVLEGGRERTESEWRRLLEGAGLEVVGIADGLVEARCP
jgi:hypothetical protein